MAAFLTYEEIRLWRSSTEKITLEEFAMKLGKSLKKEKETNDLYDIVKDKEPDSPAVEFGFNESFKKKLTEREEVVFKYFYQNKGKKVFVKELAKVLNIPNDYVYKYIKNLRQKLSKNVLVNAEDGGYILSE